MAEKIQAEEDSSPLHARFPEREVQAVDGVCWNESGGFSGVVPQYHVLQSPKKRRGG